MRVLRNTLLALVAALFVLGPTRVQAQAHNVAMVYRFTPAAGKTAAFEKALASHAAWRKQAGDPWNWAVYQVVTGEHAGSYMIRSGGHTWADLDAYDADFGPKGSARFDAAVDAVHKAIVKQNAPFHYAWFSPMDSGPGGVRGLAIFTKNWAGFEPQHPNLGQIMNQEYGQAMAGQIFDEFTGSYSHVVSQIMRYRPDLSVQHEGS